MTENKNNITRYIVFIIFGLLILGNTNNNPDTFIQRIFKPIRFGDGVAIFYAALIPMIIICKGLKGIYDHRKIQMLDTRTKRIITMIVLLIIFSNCWDYGLKAYKGLAGGLNSIYCDRDNIWLHAEEINENQVRLTTIINLENCGFKDQEFYMKIKIPREWKDYIDEEEIIFMEIHRSTNDKIYMNKRERTGVRVEAMATCRNSTYNKNSYSTRTIGNFDFILFNEDEEVMFIGRDEL
jgi:hypothetical protein